MSYQGPPPPSGPAPQDPWSNGEPPQQPEGSPPAAPSYPQSYDQPVSGQPMSGQPMSGQPSYDQSGYGAQGYGAPGYAQGYGAPGQPAPPGQPAAAGAMSTTDERNYAMFAHLGALGSGVVLGGLWFIGPLVVYLMKKDESRFVRHHALEALNLSIAATIVSYGIGLVSCVLSFVVIGVFTFFLIPLYGIAVIVLLIMGSIAANKGEWYKYPEWLAWPMVK